MIGWPDVMTHGDSYDCADDGHMGYGGAFQYMAQQATEIDETDTSEIPRHDFASLVDSFHESFQELLPVGSLSPVAENSLYKGKLKSLYKSDVATSHMDSMSLLGTLPSLQEDHKATAGKSGYTILTIREKRTGRKKQIRVRDSTRSVRNTTSSSSRYSTKPKRQKHYATSELPRENYVHHNRRHLRMRESERSHQQENDDIWQQCQESLESLSRLAHDSFIYTPILLNDLAEASFAITKEDDEGDDETYTVDQPTSSTLNKISNSSNLSNINNTALYKYDRSVVGADDVYDLPLGGGYRGIKEDQISNECFLMDMGTKGYMESDEDIYGGAWNNQGDGYHTGDSYSSSESQVLSGGYSQNPPASYSNDSLDQSLVPDQSYITSIGASIDHRNVIDNIDYAYNTSEEYSNGDGVSPDYRENASAFSPFCWSRYG